MGRQTELYLSAVDGIFRVQSDMPTIGVLLCETRNTAVVKYALQNIAQPIGVSTYRVTRELSTTVRKELPSVEDLQEVVAKFRSDIEASQHESPDEN